MDDKGFKPTPRKVMVKSGDEPASGSPNAPTGEQESAAHSKVGTISTAVSAKPPVTDSLSKSPSSPPLNPPPSPSPSPAPPASQPLTKDTISDTTPPKPSSPPPGPKPSATSAAAGLDKPASSTADAAAAGTTTSDTMDVAKLAELRDKYRIPVAQVARKAGHGSKVGLLVLIGLILGAALLFFLKPDIVESLRDFLSQLI